ncbi:MAG: cbb3-type cytochrome oxidase assembly protein CcoS [Sulfuricellaceae bacterium]|nr:cbb3-type cytochrome oxidase assembly protein CcoS [Sulfuricellaceae bacterium]
MNSTLIFLFALAGFMVLVAGIGIFWAIHSGQFEDMEGPAQRILMDEDDPRIPRRTSVGATGDGEGRSCKE